MKRAPHLIALPADTQPLRISGPFECGCFAIHSTDNRVWDGKSWRGFGPALHYPTFKEAFIAMRRKASPKYKPLPEGCI